MEISSPTKVEKAFCSSCNGQRNCFIHGEYIESYDDEIDPDYSWSREWKLLQCRGCDNVFVQLVKSTATDDREYSQEFDQWVQKAKLLCGAHRSGKVDIDWLSVGGLRHNLRLAKIVEACLP